MIKPLTESVTEIAETRKLLPKESDFQNKPGFSRTYGADGSYAWQYEYNPYIKTKEGAEVAEMLRPFQVADSERHHKNSGKIDRVPLKDKEGQTHYVEAALAEGTARARGWSHRARAGGIRVERGSLNGMFFHWLQNSWQPTGRVELGVLGKKCPTSGLQYDPDGKAWRYVEGEWRAL